MEYYGYVGQILHVDLTSGDISKQPLDMELARKFLGGWGINYRLEYDLLKPGTDPLLPDNPIIIGVGPLIGTLVPGSGKVAATMKFPNVASKLESKYIVATGIGGSHRFGAMIKNAGYDHVIITGRARKPSYLKLIDDDVEICDATDLWGRDIYETTDELANRHRGKTGEAGVWAIGKAGENLVTSALGFVDGMATMGRWGGGAVLGSKNLKAVVSLGTKGIKVKDPKRFMAAVDKKRQEIMSHPRYRSGYFVERHLPESLPYPTNLYDLTKYAELACTGCIDGCKTCFRIREGRFIGDTMHSQPLLFLSWDKFPELHLSHYGDALKLVDLIDRAGLCCMTSVRMLNFVTRLYERGVISTKDTGGLVLKTGDFNSYAQLLEKWVNREDIGEFMANGWLALSEKTGVDASTDFEDGCAIVRGGDTLHEARWHDYGPAWGVAPIVRVRSAHLHQDTYFPRAEDLYRDAVLPDLEKSFYDVRKGFEKMVTTNEEVERTFTTKDFSAGRVEKHAEDCVSIYTALGLCDAVAHVAWEPWRDIPFLAEAYSSLTSFEISPEELKEAGERVWNMEVLLNVREGFTRKDYPIPSVWLQHTEKPLNQGCPAHEYATDWFGNRITKEDMYRMVDDYYDERGYDIQKGIPTREKLRDLELEEFEAIVEPYLR